MMYKIGGKCKFIFLPPKPVLSFLSMKIRELLFYYRAPNFLAFPGNRTYPVK